MTLWQTTVSVAHVITLWFQAFFQSTSTWVRTHPDEFFHQLFVEIVMYVLVTLTLGTVVHFTVRGLNSQWQKRQEKRIEEIQLPFRQILFSRIASAHAQLLAVLTDENGLKTNWRRPSLRSYASKVADISRSLSSDIVSNINLLTDEQQQAVGAYSKAVTALQTEVSEAVDQLSALPEASVSRIDETLFNVNERFKRVAETVNGVRANAFGAWGPDDRADIQEVFLSKLMQRTTQAAAA